MIIIIVIIIDIIVIIVIIIIIITIIIIKIIDIIDIIVIIIIIIIIILIFMIIIVLLSASLSVPFFIVIALLTIGYLYGWSLSLTADRYRRSHHYHFIVFFSQALFDYYATSFDESLKGLDYSSPDALREVLGGMKVIGRFTPRTDKSIPYS